MARSLSLSIFTAFALLAPASAVADPFQWEFEELAPGVWFGNRADYSRFPVMGNTVFVVGELGVIVFDGGGAPLMSERLIEKIRSITELPVTHVIISHWHGDHNFGISRIVDEYPSVEIIAHSFTMAAMQGPPIEYIHRQPQAVPRIREMVQTALDTGKTSDGEELPEWARPRYERMLEDADLVHEEYNRLELTLPTLTLDDKLVIHSGNRRVELLFLGVGNTAGDLLMWLPDERIVATGDLVVYPTPFGFNVPPRGWADTLRALNELEYEMLVPGHGQVLRDTSYVDLLIETCESVAAQSDAAVAQGLEGEAAEAEIDFSELVERYTHGDPILADAFEGWFTTPFRKAAFKALTGEPMVEVTADEEDS